MSKKGITIAVVISIFFLFSMLVLFYNNENKFMNDISEKISKIMSAEKSGKITEKFLEM